jgi:CDP-glycerol glycerophosphotransferase (TagB/SpsB family)
MNLFAEYRLANKLIKDHHPVVFYAESTYYYQYFEQLLQDILNKTNLPVLYITSDGADPLLTTSQQRLQVAYVKRFLFFLFPKLKAGVVIMTMPDLDNFLLKRSTGVHRYVYLFHAAVSMHQQYREKAFFHYDAIFATHAAHNREIKALEEKYGWKPKDIINYGYPLLDAIAQKYTTRNQEKEVKKPPVILIAPTWFDACIFETCIEELVTKLSVLPYQVVIRAHPEYKKRRPKRYQALEKMIAGMPNMAFDQNAQVMDSLIHADLLITDRSGIAMEYALGTLRPVLFIDTPPKILNNNWQNLGIAPLENSLRSQMGVSLLPDNIGDIAETIQQLASAADSYKQSLEQIRSGLFYNADQSYRNGLDYIVAKAAGT